MNKSELEPAIEAVLFASGEPVAVERLASVLLCERGDIIEAAQSLADKYKFEKRGINLIRLDDAFQLCSSPQYSDIIRLALETRKQPQLGQSALEVLSIVAYYQPVTRAYIEQVRGVDCGYTVGLLLDRGLIEQAGRLQAPGRPMLYKTTQGFLRTFGVASLEELPEMPNLDTENSEENKLQIAIDEYISRNGEKIDNNEQN